MSTLKTLGIVAAIVIPLYILAGIGHHYSCCIYARKVRQQAQFHSIDAALELFNNDFDGYPSSDANDLTGQPYCGAMTLHEAVFGQDMLGFHRDSVFHRDGCDPNDRQLYHLLPADPRFADNLKERKGPYLPIDNVDVHRLTDLYGVQVGDFDPNARVLCDVYARAQPTGVKTGMPILYYRADPNGTTHDANNPDNPSNIYDYRDNQALLELGVPGKPDLKHPLADPRTFYEFTRSEKVHTTSAPRRPDSYILISAGYDGLYGTKDDITNFKRQ